MGSFDPMEVGRRKNESSRPVHRLDEPTGNIPRHGCVPAEPASVSPGKIIVAPQRPAVSQHYNSYFVTRNAGLLLSVAS